MSRWWRAHEDSVDHPKLLLLSDRQHRAWYNLMCLASANGGALPNIKIVALKLRMSESKASDTISGLIAARLFDDDGNGSITPHNWSKRQFHSGVSTERVKRFRKRQRNVSETVGETHQSTETETEADSPKEDKKESSLGEARKRASRLSNDWWPSQANVAYAGVKGLSIAEIGVEAEKFRNFWTAKAGKDAAKLDWDATWQNWILRCVEQGKGRKNGHDRGRDESLGDIGRRLAADARQLELAAGIRRPDDGFGEHRSSDADR